MPFIAFPAASLAWLGRQGTRAVAVSIFVGIAFPQLAAAFKPILPESVFFLLVCAFLRVEPTALRKVMIRPALVGAASGWIMVVTPLLLGGLYLSIGLDRSQPELMLALILQAAAPPVTAGTAFAALMGLDAALALAMLVITTALTPFTAPPIVKLLSGETLAMSSLSLSIKLFGLLAGSAGVAWLVRAVTGPGFLSRHTHAVDGLNVVTLFVFGVAVMDGVAARLMSDPWLVLRLLALSFAWTLALLALTALTFACIGRARAFVVGMSAGQRNLGLMLAAAAAAIPDLIWLYFALAQFPIYLLPHILKPLARRLAGAGGLARR